MCAKAFPLITPMVMYALDVGGDSTSQDPIKIDNEDPLTGLHENLLGLESVLRTVHIVHDILQRGFSVESHRDKKIFLVDTISQSDANSLGFESFN